MIYLALSPSSDPRAVALAQAAHAAAKRHLALRSRPFYADPAGLGQSQHLVQAGPGDLAAHLSLDVAVEQGGATIVHGEEGLALAYALAERLFTLVGAVRLTEQPAHPVLAHSPAGAHAVHLALPETDVGVWALGKTLVAAVLETAGLWPAESVVAAWPFSRTRHPELWADYLADPSAFVVDHRGLWRDGELLVAALTRQQVLGYWARYCRDSAPQWGLFSDDPDYGALDTYAAALRGDPVDPAALDAIEAEVAAIAARYPGMPASVTVYEAIMPEALRP